MRQRFLKSSAIASVMSIALAAPGAILHNNGPVATGTISESGAIAPAGTQWSELQHPTGDCSIANGSIGFTAHSQPTGLPPVDWRLADNFVVPAGSTWRVQEVIVYAFAFKGTTNFTPYASANIRLWRGRPGDVGSVIIAGDTTTDRLVDSSFAGWFRIANSACPPPGVTPTSTTHPLWAARLEIPILLTPDTYWIDYQVNSPDTNALFSVAVTVPGVRTLAGWNARRINTLGGPAWSDVLDFGAPTTAPDVIQDIAFQVIGCANCTTDIAPNCRTDVDDLLAVVTAWGPCPAPPTACPSNIVNTGTSINRVDVDDLLAVITAWGVCP